MYFYNLFDGRKAYKDELISEGETARVFKGNP
jgi:hypothetical protein